MIDLAAPAKILKVGQRDLASADRGSSSNSPRPAPGISPTVAEQARACRPQNRPRTASPHRARQRPAAANDKPMVVIDPGHGGVDMGAAGKHGEMEKDVVLEFARALRDKIQETGRARALY